MNDKVVRRVDVDTDSIYVDHPIHNDLNLVPFITGGNHIIQPYDDFICGVKDDRKIIAAKLMLNSLYGKKFMNSFD